MRTQPLRDENTSLPEEKGSQSRAVFAGWHLVIVAKAGVGRVDE